MPVQRARRAVHLLHDRMVDLRARRTPVGSLTTERVAVQPLADRDVVDIVTVAFGNANVVRWQQELLARNLHDPHRHTIVDNSPDPAVRAAIRADAATHGTGYVDVSPLTGRLTASSSHGAALNWAWEQLLEPRGATAVAFLDHDVYPIAPTSLRELLGPAGMFGIVQRAGVRWYLWPGLCCFARERLTGRRLDFRPGGGGDTGARNWEVLYAQVDPSAIATVPRSYEQLREGDDPHGDLYELMGDWLHSRNASRWSPTAPRDHLIERLLARQTRSQPPA